MDDQQAHNMAHESQELCELIMPLLAGRDPMVVGSALCDLVATWLAGFAIEKDPKSRASKELRDMTYEEWRKCLYRLLEVNIEIVAEQARRGSMQ